MASSTEPEQITATYRAITGANTSPVVEVRALGALQRGAYRQQTLAGYFDNAGDIVNAVKDVKARGIYITLNELNPDLLARRVNRLDVAEKGFSTGDQHVIRRRWLPIDCDPVRLADISATDAEHALALERAIAIREELRRRGWPDPILADSGNGGHLLYAIDLPVDDGGLVAGVLVQIAEQFNDAQVKIDTVNANPSRIWKLYGTQARKGDETPARPYRMARILERPEELVVTGEEHLVGLIGRKEISRQPPCTSGDHDRPDMNVRATKQRPVNRANKRVPQGGAAPSAHSFDLPAWVATHFPEAGEAQAWKSGGLIWELSVCPYNPDHTGTAFVAQQPGGAIAAGCHHNSCQGWGWAELRELKEGPRPARSSSPADAPATPETVTAALNAAADAATRETCRAEVAAAALDLVAACTAFDRADLMRMENELQRLGCTKAFCKEWRAAVGEAKRKRRPARPADAEPQFATVDGRMCRLSRSRDANGEDALRAEPICDCDLRITEELKSEGKTEFRLQGETVGGRLLDFVVDAKVFADRNKFKAELVAAAGPGMLIYPGMERYLDAAIQYLTGEGVPTVATLRRLGWWKDGGDTHFVMLGSVPPGLRVDVLDRLPYRWEDGADLDTALAGLRHALLSIDPGLTTVLLASVLTGPLGGLAGWNEWRYVTFVTGKTGSMKTSVVRLFMCLFGKGFAEDRSLVKFGEGATRNAILALATIAFDLPFFIDNYKPNTGDGEAGARNVFIVLVEGRDKDRLDEHAQYKNAREFACWPVATGEDTPLRDAGMLARFLLLTFPWLHDADFTDLSAAQGLSHHLPAAGRAWVEWLATPAGAAAIAGTRAQLAAAEGRWAKRLKELGALNWQRMARTLALNEVAWGVACVHPQLGPVLGEFTQYHAAGLDRVAVEMAQLMKGSAEAEVFLGALRELLGSKAAVLLGDGVENPGPGQVAIGRLAEDGGAYILGDVARSAVERLLGRGALNGMSNNTLYRHLFELGYIGKRDAGRNTTTASFKGTTQRVLHLVPQALGLG